MNRVLVISICAMGAAALQLATANPIVTATIGGSALGGANYLNFDGALPGFVTLNTTADSALVTGSSSGIYAAPYLSGGVAGNARYFGNVPVNGADASRYVTTGAAAGSHPNAKAVLNFASPGDYFGLLWGSVDDYNTLKFFAGPNGTGNLLLSLTGQDLKNINSSIDLNSVVHPVSNQGVNGTAYVNITGIGGYESAVFTSSSYAFEFDNVATNIPDGGSVTGVFGLGLLGLAAYARRRT